MSAADGQARGELVILVHGLYMHGIAMWPLQRHLTACGFQCRSFSYPSLRSSVSENARRLAASLQDDQAPEVHFLCHSLGGLVVRSMLLESAWQRPGRVLCLGTPHLGCYVAKWLGSHGALAWLVGKSLRHGLDGDLPAWPAERQVATIAGNQSVGAGCLVPGLPKPNDGTVVLAETDLGPEYARLVLDATHTSMLFSKQVAENACTYFKTGRFLADSCRNELARE